jgi:hypothetical protein
LWTVEECRGTRGLLRVHVLRLRKKEWPSGCC